MRKKVLFMCIVLTLLFVTIGSPTTSHGYGWGYKKNNDNKVPDVGKYGEMLKDYHAYYVDISAKKEIYITFDNGYEQGYTGKVLDVLRKHDVPATFFVTGHYVESEADLIKRMVDEGHIIGNHSYNHPDFTTMSKAAMEKELRTLDDAVAEISNQKELIYMRPPRGTFNEQTLKWANELGYVHMFWSVAFKDWETDKQKGWKYSYDQIMNQIHPGAILLLHTVSSDNAEALEKVIIELKKQGYSFKSLDYLMGKSLLPDGVLF